MKKIVLVLIFGLVAFSACKKSGMHLFRGDYSFKTSGGVTMDEIVPEGDTVEPISYTVSLPNEIGQLEISDLGNQKDSVLVVMNTMGGEVVVTHAFCNGKEIYLKDFTKNTLLFTGDTISLKNEVRVRASGQMYENNTLILNMVYDGEAEINERGFTIHGDNIRLVAIRN